MTLTNGINSNGKLTQFGISSNNFDPNTSINPVSQDILGETNNNDQNNYNNNNNNNVEENESSSAESDAVLLIDSKKPEAEDSESLNNIEDNTDLENEMIRLSEESNLNTDDKKIEDDNESAFSEDASTLTASGLESETCSESDISLSNSISSSTSSSPPPEVELDEKQKLLSAINNATYLKMKINNQLKSLPWKPKVRLCELESFLDQERKKFLGYGDLTNDLNTLIGLPNPIHESVRILKQHLYVSLADEQIKLEEKIYKYPMSTQNSDENKLEDEEAPAEVLFSSLLNNLPQYLVN